MKPTYLLRFSIPLILLAMAFFSCDMHENPVKSFEEALSRVPDVKLISGAENATVIVNNDRRDSYFTVTIENTEGINGVFNAWCVELDKTVRLGVEHAGTKLYDGNNDEVFNKLRYIIYNRSNYENELQDLSWRDIQVAFWVILETENYSLTSIEERIPSTFGEYNSSHVNEILNDVKQNAFSLAFGDGSIIYYQLNDNQNGIIIPPPCEPCKGGITQLTLRNEGPAGTIVVHNSKDTKGEILFNDYVATGDEFTFTKPAGDSKMKSDISVYRDGIFVTTIHTSCSKPIGPGSVFVDFVVVQAFSEKGLLEVCPVPPPPDCEPCKGGIVQLTLQNKGADGQITVYNSKDTKGTVLFNGNVSTGGEFTFTQPAGDDKMKSDISVYRDGIFVTTIHTSCSKPIGPGSVFVDFEVVQAFSKDNQAEVCPVPPPPDCEPCKGGIVQLTLKNEGAAGTIVVYNSKDTKGAILFNGAVGAGGEFTFTQPAGEDKMKSDISVYRDGILVTTIHTSCSKPIGPGSVFVDFEVVQAFSKDNQAEVCPV